MYILLGIQSALTAPNNSLGKRSMYEDNSALIWAKDVSVNLIEEEEVEEKEEEEEKEEKEEEEEEEEKEEESEEGKGWEGGTCSNVQYMHMEW